MKLWQTISLRRGDAGHGEDGCARTVLLEAFLWGTGSLNSNWSPDDDFGGAAKARGMTPDPWLHTRVAMHRSVDPSIRPSIHPSIHPSIRQGCISLKQSVSSRSPERNASVESASQHYVCRSFFGVKQLDMPIQTIQNSCPQRNPCKSCRNAAASKLEVSQEESRPEARKRVNFLGNAWRLEECP